MGPLKSNRSHTIDKIRAVEKPLVLVRGYNKRLRSGKSKSSQKVIIDALVELVVERQGEDVTFAEVAERSKVSERSIYRFFNDKASLHEAMNSYLLGYLGDGNELLAQMDLPELGQHAYEIMDLHESKVLAYLYSPFGRKIRSQFRKKIHAMMALKILETKQIPMTVETGKKIAVIVSLVNANLWHDLREDTGYTGAELGPSIAWAMNTLITAL